MPCPRTSIPEPPSAPMDPRGSDLLRGTLSAMKGPRSLGIVIKLGTSSIVDAVTHEPLISILSQIVETAVRLRNEGHRVVIVSSGAIGVALRRMDLEHRPKHLAKLQALAAIGQCRLISLWDSLFEHLRQPIAQILLTRNDISDRTQYRRAQNTFAELFDMGVIPIVNENDTLAVEEIKFGDNDTLSAITAAMIHADVLFLMTDVDCLYTKNPRQHPDAEPIEVVEDISALEADISTPGSALGTGGMSTKIVAARLATSAGVTTIITRSLTPGNLLQILATVQPQTGAATGAATDTAAAAATSATTTTTTTPLHTRFLPWPEPIRDRSFWILHGLTPHGIVYIDQGAHQALLDHRGLLPAGVVDVEGTFGEDEAVRLVVVERPAASAAASAAAAAVVNHALNNHSHAHVHGVAHSPRHTPSHTPTHGTEVGRALVKYASTELVRIKGRHSHEIAGILGYATSEYIAPREHISLFRRKDSRPASAAPSAAPSAHSSPLHHAIRRGGAGVGGNSDVEKLVLNGVADYESRA